MHGITCGQGRIHFYIATAMHGYICAADLTPPRRLCIMSLSAACSRECMQPLGVSHARSSESVTR